MVLNTSASLQMSQDAHAVDATQASLVGTPVTVEESGLSLLLLEDIVSRQLQESGVSDIRSLSVKTCLSSRLLDIVIEGMRADARLEVLGPAGGSKSLRYNLTDNGRRFAREARERSGYIGPAPISSDAYVSLIQRQSVKDVRVTRQEMQDAYADVVISEDLLDRLGTSLHSGKAIFIYGPAGTGKTFLCSRLIRLLQTPVLIPHAIVVGDSIVRVYDPAVHKALESTDTGSAWLSDQTDPRMVLCERPFIVSGGELTMDLLEIQKDVSTNQYLAPLQMKSTHGIYMVDDLGRQRMSTDELFNRWIVPMESGLDYLNMDSGARLKVPFDVVLIFSTNMLPEDLDDPAFQRRIGHKIGFDYADAAIYTKIWRQECDKRGINFDPKIVEFAITELHSREAVPMLACHPRDLIGMSLDYARYSGEPDRISQDGLRLAWDNYFARAVEAPID